MRASRARSSFTWAAPSRQRASPCSTPTTIAGRRPPCSRMASPSPRSRTFSEPSPRGRDRAARTSAWASRGGDRGSSRARSRAATGSPCPRTRASSSMTPTRRSGIGRWPSGGSASRFSPAHGCVPAMRRASEGRLPSPDHAESRSPIALLRATRSCAAASPSPRRYGSGEGSRPPLPDARVAKAEASSCWRLGSGGELAVHAEGAVELAGEDEGARVGNGHVDLDGFLGEDVAIELAGNGDVVQGAGLVLDAQAEPLSRLAAQESGAEVVVVRLHLHDAERANVARAVVGEGHPADGHRLRLRPSRGGRGGAGGA